jgi:hypothetical protein
MREEISDKCRLTDPRLSYDKNRDVRKGTIIDLAFKPIELFASSIKMNCKS